MITSLESIHSTALDDEILIARFQGGDKQAFDTLVQKHRAWAFGYARRLTGNADDAADLTADVFLRVFRALKNFNGSCRFRTWLYAIETNSFRDRRKRRFTPPTLSLDFSANPEGGETFAESFAANESPHDLAVEAAERGVVRVAISRMRQSDQTMIDMFYREERSYMEIAVQLELPIGTVKSRLNRARHRLKQLMAESAPGA